jgi:uncharacterized Zn finger protein
MTPTHPQASLILEVLRRVPLDRIQKAIAGLMNNSMKVTIDVQKRRGLWASVEGDSGQTYTVIIVETSLICSCRDAEYRDGACKHLAAAVLYVLRATPPEELQDPEEEAQSRRESSRIKSQWMKRLAERRKKPVAGRGGKVA